ncbi:MAG: cryptic plasmid protein A [Lysobacteraceae bacterium]|nr:MAG: cryptic plasmid protein A [Xanthomonadaceae bacterium]
MILVESKRDQRVLDWLVEQVGHEGVAEACSKLAGARRAYPSNIAKVLGLEPPQRLAVAARSDAAFHLAEIARILGVRLCN